MVAGGVQGSAGKGTLFSSGSKQYFDVPDSGSLDVSEKFTITFAVRSDETSPAGDMDVLSKFRGTVAGVQEPYRFGV